jgi:hypothetical protein
VLNPEEDMTKKVFDYGEGGKEERGSKWGN